MSTFKKDKSKLKVSAMVARAANGVIGINNKIPWQGKLKGEQLLFKTHTMGKAVIMGRNTWESIPENYRPLPLRLNMVLTSRPNLNKVGNMELASLEEALLTAEATSHYNEAVLIGGQRVYEEGLQYCDTLYLTTLEAIFPGDVYFPEIDMNKWSVEREEHYPIYKDRSIAYNFQILRRVK